MLGEDESVATKRPDKLTSKFQIGSTHGPIAYGPEEIVFHASDIPQEKRRLREEVKASAARDILGVKQAQWNISSKVDEQLCLRKLRTLTEHDRVMHVYNYRAEVLPPSNPDPVQKASKFRVNVAPTTTISKAGKDTLETPGISKGVANRTGEMEVHPALRGKAGWNSSTFVEKRERGKHFRDLEAMHKKNSTARTASLTSSGTYHKPQQLYKVKQQQQRLQKEILRNRELVEPNKEEPPIPAYNREAVEKPVRYRKFKHTGAWEHSRLEGCEVWSCCLCTTRDALGCVPIVVNPNAYNYSSI